MATTRSIAATTTDEDAAAQLVGEVDRLCASLLAELTDPEHCSRVEQTRAQLRDPLRVAVVGSVSAGKSTLVNTLLRRTVAPVGSSDTTKVVTWYRFDAQERLEIQLRDGQVLTSALGPGGRVPDALEARLEQVAALHVFLSNDVLRSLVLIDTPGLDTVNADAQARTEEFLGLGPSGEGTTSGTLDAADAVVYVFTRQRSTDAEFLRELMAGGAQSRTSAMNVVGVLSKVDRVVEPGQDPWPTARTLAERAASELAATVSTVVPVIGLLGQAARAGQITEADGRALRILAALPAARDALRMSVGSFLAEDGDGWPSLDARRRLFDLLDRYGVLVGMDALERSTVLSSALSAWESTSNVVALEGALLDRFRRRASLLKIDAALTALEELSYISGTSPDGMQLRALRHPLERIELDPVLHDLRVLAFARSPASSQLAAELVDDIRSLSHADDAARVGLPASATPSEVAAAAAAGAGRWSAVANDSIVEPAVRRGARDVKRAFELIWERQQ
jgi:predicted GTPase